MDYHNMRNAIDAEFFAQRDAASDSDDDSDASSELLSLPPPEPEEPVVQAPPDIADLPRPPPETYYRKRLITVDSRFRDFQSPSSTNFFHTFPAPLRNIIKMRLMGIEYNFGAYPFSHARGNTTFQVNLGSGWETVAIPVGYYPNVASLLNVLNAVLEDLNIDLQFAQITPSLRVKITTTSTSIIGIKWSEQDVSLAQANLTLGMALGFYYPGYSVSSIQPARGERLPSTDIDSYYLLQLDGVHALTHFMGTDTLPALHKLQLPANSWGSTIVVDQSVASVQEVTFPQPITLRKWEFQLLDAWGQPVDNNDGPISMTFELTEVFHAGVAEQWRQDAVPGD